MSIVELNGSVLLPKEEYQRLLEIEEFAKTLSISLDKLTAEKDELQEKYDLEHEDRLRMLQGRFKKSSEVQDPSQLMLFNDAELGTDEGAKKEAEEKGEDVKDGDKKEATRRYTKHKVKNDLTNAPADTPIVERRIEIEPETCPECGAEMVKVGEEVHDRLVKKTVLYIERLIKPIYGCPNCGEKVNKPFNTGDILSSTICSPLFLADIITNKFEHGLPLYRIPKMLANDGIDINYQTISAWVMYAGNKIIDNIKPILEEEVMKYPLVNADETSLEVVELFKKDGTRKGPNSRSNAYMFVREGTDSRGRPGLVDFTYLTNRQNATISTYFTSYHGILQSDGLSGYDYTTRINENIVHCSCLIHYPKK